MNFLSAQLATIVILISPVIIIEALLITLLKDPEPIIF